MSGLSSSSQVAIIKLLKLSEAEAIAALQGAGLTAEEATATASTIASGTAAGGASVSITALGTSFKAAAVGVMTFLATNPIGWAILAGTAIFGVVKAVDALTTSYSEAQEASAKSREEYQQTASELDSINSELETTQQRIDELKSKGALTITEKEELSQLQAQNSELERQYEIKSKLAQVQAGQAAKDASDTLLNSTRTYKTGTTVDSQGVTVDAYSSGTIIDETYEKQKQLNVKTEEYNKLLDAQSKLTPDFSSWWESDTQYEINEKRLKTLKSDIDSLQSDISNNLSDINTEYGSLYDSNGKVVSGFEDVAKQCEDLFEYTLSSTDQAEKAQEKIDSILSRPTLSNTKDELIAMAQASDGVGISAEYIEKNYSNLADAARLAGVDIQDLVDTINSMAGVENFDEMRKQLENAFTDDASNLQVLEKLKGEWGDFTKELSNEEISILYGIYQSQDTSAWSIDDWKIALEEAKNGAEESGSSYESLKAKIDSVTESMDTLKSAMSSSSSGSGISMDEFNAIDKMFSGLDGYDASKVFETTANGIRINTEAARELTAQYEAQTKLDLANKLSELGSEYDELTERLKNCTEGSEEYNQILSQRDAIESEIQNVSLLASEYDGLTSKYQKWIDAQSSTNEGNMYDNITSSLDKMKDLYKEGLVGTDDFRTGVDFMTYEDMSTASVDELVEAYKKANKTMNTYFKDGQEGCVRFLEDLHELNSDWASMNKDGSWEIDFNDKEVAKKLGISVEAVQAIMRKLSDYGFDINLDSPTKSIQELKDKIEETESALKGMGEKPVEININADDVDSEIEKAKSKIQEINDSDISAEVKTAQLEDANAKLDVLIQKKHEAENPSFMSIDVNQVNASLTEAIGYLKEYQTAVNDLDTLEIKGADSSEIEDAKKKVDELAGKIQGLDKDTKVSIGLEADGSIDSIKQQIANNEVVILKTSADTTQAQTDIDNINGKDISLSVNTSGNEAIDALKSGLDSLTDKTVTVTAKTIGTDEVDGLKKSQDTVLDKKVTTESKVKGEKEVTSLTKAIKNLTGKVVNVIANVIGKSNVDSLRTSINNVRSKTVYINSVSTSSVAKYANGTAHTNGTAYASGDWSVKRTETALGGEVGQELVVRDGKYFTLDYPQLFQARKGDIIFDANQTAQLLSKGKITSGNKFGQSYAEGTAYSGGSGTFYNSGKKVTSHSNAAKSSSNKSSNKKSSSEKATEKAAKSVSKAAKDTKDFIDFAEIKSSRLSDATDAFIKSAGNSEKLSSILTNYQKAISNINKEISANQSAYHMYKGKAANVKLSNSIKARIQSGSINVSEYGEETRKLISQYQEFYEKALKCKQAVYDLKIEQKELAKTKLDTIIDRYSMKTDYTDSKRSLLESKLDYRNTAGYSNTSDGQRNLYKSLISNEKGTIKQNEAALKQYKSELNKQVKAGLIRKGSDEYYEAYKQIQELNSAIIESKSSISEWTQEVKNMKTVAQEYAVSGAQRSLDKVKNNISLKESQGKVITASNYNSEIKANNNLIKEQQKLIKAYKSEQKNYSKNSDKYQDLADSIASAESEIYDLKISNEELKDSIRNLNITKLEYAYNSLSRVADKFKNSLSLKEAKGKFITKNDYTKEINNNNGLISSQESLIKEYKRQQKNYSNNSEKYQELADEIFNAENEIIDLKISNEELKDAIKGLEITKLEYALGSVSRAAETFKNSLSLKEAKGKVITENDYKEEIKYNNRLIAREQALINEYKSQQKDYSKDSEKYQELADSIASAESEIYDLKISNEELKDSIKDLKITKLEYALNFISRSADKLKNSLKLKEAKGKDLTESDYNKEIVSNNDLIKQQKLLINEYKNQQKSYSVGSEKYQELAENIADCENEINDLLISNEELKDSIREARWKKFNDLQDEIDNSITELEYLRDMLDDTFVDENGNLTDSGIANIALINQGISAQKGVIADYTEALRKLDEELKNGNISQSEYNDTQKEYMSVIRDSASAIKDYENELIDMYKSQLEAQNDVLSDEIELRQKALEAKKDYYDYDKTIRNKNKDIQSLKSQIAALEGTTTAAGRAKMAQLKAELEEAQEDLDDTMRDHEYDIKISGYDQVKDDAQNVLDSTLMELETNSELQQNVINNMLGTIKTSYSTAYSEINNIIKSTGLVISDTTKNAINELKNVSSAIKAVNDANKTVSETKPSSKVSSVNTSKIDTTNSSDNPEKYNAIIEKSINNSSNSSSKTTTSSSKTNSSSNTSTVKNTTSTNKSSSSSSSTSSKSSSSSSSSTSSSKNTASTIVKATSVKLSKSTVSITVGKSITLSASASPSKASVKWVWSTSNSSIATVSSGKVTGKKAGTATITVKDSKSGKTAKCTVTVKKASSSSSSKSSIWNGIGKDASDKGNKSLDINKSIVDRVKYYGYKSDKSSRAKLYSNLGGSGTYKGTASQNTWMIAQMKKKGYASGTKSASAGYHWYDEYGIGSEMYIDNGGILKQFEGGETVFNQDMVKNLWDLAQTPPSVLLDNMSIGKEVYTGMNNSNNQTANVNNTFNVDFNIDKLGKTSPQEMKKLYEEFYKYVDKRLTTQAYNYGVKKKV